MLTEQLDVFIASSLHGAEKRQGRRADSLEFRHKMWEAPSLRHLQNYKRKGEEKESLPTRESQAKRATFG